MGDPIVRLTDSELGRLIEGLQRGTIPLDASPLQLARAGLADKAEPLTTWLPQSLVRFGSTTSLIASLQMVQADRLFNRTDQPTDLVVTGPTADGDSNRDTRVVIREILESSRQSVLIVGYAFFGSHTIFEPLAQRMGMDTKFQTRIILNVHPIPGQSPTRTLSQSAQQFAKLIWPFHPRPEVYFLPCSIEPDSGRRASVHAKLVVADEETVYIGSANFTTAAFRRNIEVGIRVQNPVLAQNLVSYFDSLIGSDILQPLFKTSGNP